jgi:hypothetical protein
MAVTAAPARQALAKRGFQVGELAVDQQENKVNFAPFRKSFPLCSIDGHYDLVCANHIQTSARSGFDSSWVSAKSLDLSSQRLV